MSEFVPIIILQLVLDKLKAGYLKRSEKKMKRNDFLKAIEDIIHPCNSMYRKSKADTAKRIATFVEETYGHAPEQPDAFVKCNSSGYGFTRRSYILEWEKE